MALPQCPNCHAIARRAGNQLYCASCGWNRDGAIAVLRGNLKMMPLGVVVFFGFTAFMIRGWHFRNPIQIAIFCCVPAFGMLLNYVFAKRSLATLEALPTPAPRPAGASDGSAMGIRGRTSSAAEGVQQSPETSAKYQALLRTSRPREIRMSSSGKFGIIAGTLFSLGLATAFGAHVYTKWALHQSFVRFHTEDWVVGGIGALLLLVPYGIWRGQRKECDLLENGDVALANVTRQWSGDKGSSSIECEFKDSSGQVRNFSGFDNTRSLFVGMTVPVFYDRENPARQVAYCATAHEVVT